MAGGEVINVIHADQLGSPEGREFRAMEARPESPLRLQAVAVAQPEFIGKRLGEIIATGPGQDDIPVISLQQAVEEGDSSTVVVNSLKPAELGEWSNPLAVGRDFMIVIGSPVAGLENVVLHNAYCGNRLTDAEFLDWYRADKASRLIATGAPASILSGIALRPLQPLGIKEVEIESLSDGNIDEALKIEAELPRLLGDINKPERLTVNAFSQPRPWPRGLYQQLKVSVGRPVAESQVEELLAGYKTKGYFYLPDNPAPPAKRVKPERFSLWRSYGEYTPAHSPIRVLPSGLPLSDRDGRLPPQYPMRVKARLLEHFEAESRDLSLEVSGDNVVLGAAGAGLMNIIYARHMAKRAATPDKKEFVIPSQLAA